MSPTTQVSSKHLEANRQGIFALPEDTTDSYAERIERYVLQEEVSQHLAPREVVRRLYGVDPSWVPVVYSKQGLYPWEAGCTWYGESLADPPSIQLAPHFQKASTYFGCYHRDEVLAHEYVHAVRAPLGSQSFEEIFAYYVSHDFAKRRLRTFLGPLFEKPSESLFLVVLLSLFVIISLMELEGFILFTALFTGGTLAYFFGRLVLRWRQWWRCRRRLEPLAGQATLALMLRLSDEEVVRFSQLTSQKIAEWITDQKQNNFRWQLLWQAYVNLETAVRVG